MSSTGLSHVLPVSFLNESTLQRSLGEEFSLSDKGNMVFHWADFHETCDAVKKAMEDNQEMGEEFRRKEHSLALLAHIPVWVKTKAKVHQTTMFELYEKTILNQSGAGTQSDLSGNQEISFISGTGPFKSMTVHQCFNPQTYKDFIMVYLIKGQLPKRDYRIRLKSKILMEYGQQSEHAQLIQLEQLAMNGILISMDSDFYHQEITGLSEIRFMMDTQFLMEGATKNLAELKTFLSQYAFNLMYSSRKEDAVTCKLSDFKVQSSFDFLQIKKVYLYMNYEKLHFAQPETLKAVKAFVEHTRELVREHYRHMAEKLKCA
jgi:hypothetical protein